MNFIRIRELKTLDDEPYTAKRIRICDLPDSGYKRQLESMVTDVCAAVWVVGKPGHKLVKDWAAYIGHPMYKFWKPEHKIHMLPYVSQNLPLPEGTVACGDKLDKQSAEILFPEYKHLKYRP